MTYFWSLHLNFNFCMKCLLSPQTVTYISQYGKCLQYIIQCGKGSTIYQFNMDCGPQYISSIWNRVHTTFGQYKKWSTIHQFNMGKGPQYIVNTESVHSSVWKSVQNKFVQYGKCPQYISSEKCPQCRSIRKRVHNTLV